MPAWVKNNLVVLIAGAAVGVVFVAGWALALRFQPLVAAALVLGTVAIGWAIFRPFAAVLDSGADLYAIAGNHDALSSPS